jgi:hypothetical protein
LVSVTLTPGRTEPLESTTVPLISPDGVCADAGSASAVSRTRQSSNRLHIAKPPKIWSAVDVDCVNKFISDRHMEVNTKPLTAALEL